MKQTHYPRPGETVLSEKLENGLTVLVVPKKGFSTTYAYFATNYGSIDTKFKLDGHWKSSPDGIAHYLEHKMFDTKEGNALQELAQNGASPNAYTSYGITAYHFECTDHFQENLKILLSFVSVPYYTEESVEKERGIIEQEIRMGLDSPRTQVMHNLFKLMYEHHPVKVPIIGSIESIGEITAQTLYDCHEVFYHPSNMVLCVVGDADPEQVVKMAAEILPTTKSLPPERDYGQSEPEYCEGHRMEAKMEVSMPLFMIGYKCGPASGGRELLKQELLGDLAAESLMGPSSPLYARLYEKGLINSSFYTGFESGIPGVGMIISGGESPDPDAVSDEIMKEARRVLESGLSGELFDRLKKAAVGKRIREFNAFDDICYRQATSFFSGVEYNSFIDIFDELTVSDAEQFLKAAITEEKTALSIVSPVQKKEGSI